MNLLGEDVPEVELVAQVLSIAKVPTSYCEIRKKIGLNAWNAQILYDKLITRHLLKLYAQNSGMEGPMLIIAPKGHEFLRRYKNLLKALGLDPKNPKALEDFQ
jgi:predicted transcriptional regulator